MMTKSKEKSPSTGSDAIALLKADHKKVKGLFVEFNKLCEAEASGEEKGEVAAKICMELTVHAQAEEEVFYPALREAGVKQAIMDEAHVEHAGAKDLIAQISSMQPDEPLYDAKVLVLGEYIDHHVKEEEGEMFPKAKKAGVDMTELGGEIEVRKVALMDLYEPEGGNGKSANAVDSEDDEPVGKLPKGVGKVRMGDKKSNGAGLKSR